MSVPFLLLLVVLVTVVALALIAVLASTLCAGGQSRDEYDGAGDSADVSQPIIHISGPSGAGKTTLGEKIAAKFPYVIVKDIDDLRAEFIREFYGDKPWTTIDAAAYQKYIDDFVHSFRDHAIVFVGLNNMPWWHPDLYYNMHSAHNYYIDIDTPEVIRRKCTRFFHKIPTSSGAMRDLAENNARFIKKVKQGIDAECSAESTVAMNAKWAADYKRAGYTFASADEIFKDIARVLNKSAVLYHGSKHALTALDPRPSRVIGGESAVFATNTRWLALVFIANATDANIECGVIGDNGRSIPYIAEARAGAFELLKIPGHIYTVSARGFKSDPRLGMRRHEFIKRSSAKILHTETVKSVWDELRREPVTLVPYADRDAWNKKWDIPV
jgi:hypothetical protein